MYEKELQRILTTSQNNALTFPVGAGVSALSGAPTWNGGFMQLVINLDECKNLSIILRNGFRTENGYQNHGMPDRKMFVHAPILFLCLYRRKF